MSSLKTIDSNFDRLTRKNKELHARSRAAFALSMVWQGRSVDEALERVNSDNTKDSAFCQELAYGSCRWDTRHQWYLKKLLDKPLKTEATLVKAVLCIGLYQLEHSNIPTHAAVDMSVRTIRELDLPKFAGLVNAVLRNYGRKKEQLMREMPVDAKFSYPEWLIRLFSGRFEDAESILEAQNQYPPMTLRVNPNTDVELLSQEVIALGSQIDKASLSDHAFWVNPSVNSGLLTGMGINYFVQDEAAQLAAFALDAKSTDTILDLCAAPGGKALHLQALAQPTTPICVVEVSKRRLNEMRRRFEVAKQNFEIVQNDAADPELLSGRLFSRILVDAPCSGLGVIRRHPDIKLLRRKDDIKQYAQLQLNIINNAVRLLEKGGRLLYCTCTVSEEENESVIAKLMDENKELMEIDLDSRFGESKEFGYQRAPGSDNTDGFYYCLLEKRA